MYTFLRLCITPPWRQAPSSPKLMVPTKPSRGPQRPKVFSNRMWGGGVRMSGMYDWSAMRERVKTKGLRNSLLMAPMPTASTAQILWNNECFKPYTTNIYLRRTLAGEFVVVNKHLVEDLKRVGLWSKEMKDLMVKAGGSIQNIVDIPE